MTKVFFDQFKSWLLRADLDLYNSFNDKKKSVFLTIFFYLMTFVLIFFIIVSLFRHDYRHALIDGLVLICISILFALFRVKKLLLFSSHFFVLCLSAVIYFYTITGGVEHTGLLFSLLMPVPIFLLMGRKSGVWVLSVFFILAVVGILIGRGNWAADYSYNYLLRVAICFLLISFLAYLNEVVFELIYQRLEQTADSLEKSRENYRMLSISREKFLSIISHDLKNQLAGFYSASEMLKNNYDDFSEIERKDLINIIAETSGKNMRLLQDLLRWSMIKNETFPYNPVSLKIEKIYREVIDLFDVEIERKKIAVFLKAKSNSEVYADYDMLSAIVRNIVSNAIKYTGEKGEITIKAKEKGDFMEITVKDNGPGIAPSILDRIRQSLAAKSNDENNQYGSGIGLILVKEFVRCNKGELKVESEPGIGTSVSFTVPLSE